MRKLTIDKNIKITQCKDCNGRGFIVAPSSQIKASCIFCNGKGSTIHGSLLEENQQIAAFKIIWDWMNGKNQGWYH